jgi:hypothetical protein
MKIINKEKRFVMDRELFERKIRKFLISGGYRFNGEILTKVCDRLCDGYGKFREETSMPIEEYLEKIEYLAFNATPATC